MPDFTTFLPSEIICAILSHLDQRDCLRCMCVSHRWFITIPQHMQEVWNSVEISALSLSSRLNKRFLHCLGLYTQKVHILRMDGDPMCRILEVLGDMNCPLTLIEMECLEFENDYYHYYGADRLYMRLKLFSGTLTDLTLLNQSSVISPVDLLYHLPALTHMTVLYSRPASDDLECTLPNRANAMTKFASNIVFLNVDSALQYGQWIMALLSLCPQLKALIVATQYTTYCGNLADRDFDMILELCPHLQFVVWGCTADSYRPPGDNKYQQWRTLTMAPGESNQVGIREFELDGYIDHLDAALPLLARSQQTLKYLDIYNLDEGGGRELQGLGSMRFPNMKRLQVSDIQLTSTGWVNLISSCQAMEHMKIHNAQWPVHESINAIITAISNLTYLQKLELGIDLQIANVGHPDLCRGLYTLSRSTHLRSLRLYPMCLSRQGLLGLCEIQSLQELYIHVSPRHQHCLQANEWIAFAERLALVNNSLQALTLDSISKITDEAMQCLGRAKQLSDLRIYGAPDITDTGADLFLSSEEKEPNMDRMLRIRYCRGVLGGNSSNRFISE